LESAARKIRPKPGIICLRVYRVDVDDGSKTLKPIGLDQAVALIVQNLVSDTTAYHWR
jgi:hypothetical protein